MIDVRLPFMTKNTFNKNTRKKEKTQKSANMCGKTFFVYSWFYISYEIYFKQKHIIYCENKGEGQIKSKKKLFMLWENSLCAKNGLIPHQCIFMSSKWSQYFIWEIKRYSEWKMSVTTYMLVHVFHMKTIQLKIKTKLSQCEI